MVKKRKKRQTSCHKCSSNSPHFTHSPSFITCISFHLIWYPLKASLASSLSLPHIHLQISLSPPSGFFFFFIILLPSNQPTMELANPSSKLFYILAMGLLALHVFTFCGCNAQQIPDDEGTYLSFFHFLTFSYDSFSSL